MCRACIIFLYRYKSVYYHIMFRYVWYIMFCLHYYADLYCIFSYLDFRILCGSISLHSLVAATSVGGDPKQWQWTEWRRGAPAIEDGLKTCKWRSHRTCIAVLHLVTLLLIWGETRWTVASLHHLASSRRREVLLHSWPRAWSWYRLSLGKAYKTVMRIVWMRGNEWKMGKDQKVQMKGSCLLEVTVMHSFEVSHRSHNDHATACRCRSWPFSARLTVAGHGQQTKTEISPEESGEKSDTGMEWHGPALINNSLLTRFETTTQTILI